MAKRLALQFDAGRVCSHIWSISSFIDTDYEAGFTADLDAGGIAHSCLQKIPHKKDFGVVRRLAAHIRRERYDVVHMHCSSPAFYGRLAASLVPGVKRLVTIHNHMSRSEVIQEMLLGCLTDRFVACSSEVERDLLDRCRISRRKVACILNGVGRDRTQNVREPREEIRRRFGIDPDEQVALVLGRMMEQKAQLDLLEALVQPGERLSRLKVLMAGDDSKEYAKLVRASIASKGLRSRVQILGMVDDATIDALLKAADLFLLPSLREGLSVAILEALGSGLPAVISDLENNREVTDNGRVAWLTPPGNPEKLALVLEEVLAAPQEMAERAQAAGAFVQKKFSFDRVVREYTETYEQVVASR